MTTQANNSNKNTSYKISDQVKLILHKKGLSKAFNYGDYNYFKQITEHAFNRAQAIANKFIEEHQEDSDLNQYIF